jgi:hypothetical protein
MTILWCLIQGQRSIFSVSIPFHLPVELLKKQIYEEHVNFIAKCGSSRLTLTKVRGCHDLYEHQCNVCPQVNKDFNTVEERLIRGAYLPDANDKELETPTILTSPISEVWSEPPPHVLHVFVGLPDGVGSPILNAGGECLHMSLCPRSEYLMNVRFVVGCLYLNAYKRSTSALVGLPPPRFTSLTSASVNFSLRGKTVSALYDRMKRHGFILVCDQFEIYCQHVMILHRSAVPPRVARRCSLGCLRYISVSD